MCAPWKVEREGVLGCLRGGFLRALAGEEEGKGEEHKDLDVFFFYLDSLSGTTG